MESFRSASCRRRARRAERPAPAAVTLAVPDLDLSDAVSIAAGSGVEDLIVGASETPAPAENTDSPEAARADGEPDRE